MKWFCRITSWNNMYQNQVIMCTQKVANFCKKLWNTPNKKLWNGKKLIFQLVALAQICEFSIGLRDWEWPTCIHIFYHISITKSTSLVKTHICPISERSKIYGKKILTYLKLFLVHINEGVIKKVYCLLN
jgi:hypothetical protein